MRKKSLNQIRIEFTHDVIKFKETHKLKRPPDHIPTPISSETHIATVARSHETRAYLCGRKKPDGGAT